TTAKGLPKRSQTRFTKIKPLSFFATGPNPFQTPPVYNSYKQTPPFPVQSDSIHSPSSMVSNPYFQTSSHMSYCPLFPTQLSPKHSTLLLSAKTPHPVSASIKSKTHHLPHPLLQYQLPSDSIFLYLSYPTFQQSQCIHPLPKNKVYNSSPDNLPPPLLPSF